METPGTVTVDLLDTRYTAIFIFAILLRNSNNKLAKHFLCHKEIEAVSENF